MSKMDPRPLTPKNNKNEAYDPLAIMQEVFQDLLVGVPEFSKDVARNSEKYSSQNASLKASGVEVANMYRGAMLYAKDVGLVEDDVMIRQAMFLVEDDFINRSRALIESLKLKREQVYMDLNVDCLQKYNLLRKGDLLPTEPERSMDFRINSNKHLCPLPCGESQDVHSVKEPKKCNRSRRRLPNVQTPIERPCRHQEQNERIFVAVPDVLIFQDYEIRTTYRKKFKLRNVTKTKQSFVPCMLPKSSRFKVELDRGFCTRLAPGMCAVFTVEFQTDIYRDTKETAMFNTYGRQVAKVDLINRRGPPVLTVLIIKNLQQFSEKLPASNDSLFIGNERSIVLNSTVDCGSCLLGNRIHLNLIITNNGKWGRFFFVHEEDWYLGNVNALNRNLTLRVGVFEITPAFFRVGPEEFVRISLTFFPGEYGLAVEKLFLLCDNNTFEELEVIGDGLVYQQDTVRIELPSKLPNDNNADARSEYLLHFHKCIPHQQRNCVITVRNNCIADLTCEWKQRVTDCHVIGTRLMRMNSDWISVCPSKHSLLGQSVTDFGVTLECKSTRYGLYSTVFALYVLDVPRESLVENFEFKVVAESEDGILSNWQPVMVGEVEVMCEVVHVDVLIDPPNITVPHRIGYGEEFCRKIQIYTSAPTDLSCEWRTTSSGLVEITPVQFVLVPGTIYVCDVRIRPGSYRDVDEELMLLVNENLCKKRFAVVARTDKPLAEFSETALNFGCLPKSGKRTFSKDLYVRNVGCESVSWTVFEFVFDFDNNRLVELNAARHLSIATGQLDAKEACKVTYTIDNGDQRHCWLSFLVLLSVHPVAEAMRSFCLVTYEMTEPQMVLHTAGSIQPILYPGELLYLNHTTEHIVCLHNVGSQLPGSFVWGRPAGRRAHALIIKCSPKGGVVQPQRCVHVRVSVTPLETGVFDEVYLPCFVGNTDEPIKMLVLCAADNIHLYFRLPDGDGGHRRIFWPPKGVHSLEDVPLNLEHSQPNRSSVCFEERSSARECSTTCMRSIGSCLDSELVLQQNVMEVRDVPLRTHVKRTIVMENVTPLRGHFRVKAMNFRDSEEPPTDAARKAAVLDEILAEFDIASRRSAKRQNKMHGYMGMVVEPLPAQGTIEPCAVAEFDVGIYADTWGTYTEEILVEIDDVAPFCFSVVIEVVGVPVEFPFALNFNNGDCPVLRFGSVPYLSRPIERILKVKNQSSVPLRVAWHVFLYERGSEDAPSDPFNVVMDNVRAVTDDNHQMSNDDDEENGTGSTWRLMITPEYYGREDDRIFRVRPRESNISPGSTESITVTVHAAHFNVKYERTDIEAILIGHVHLARQFRMRPSVYSRRTGVSTLPAKVYLSASVQLPRVTLDLVKGDTQVKAYATDVIRSEKKLYTLMLMFKNTGDVPVDIYVHVSRPFCVVSVRTIDMDGGKAAAAVSVIRAGSCVEVVVECTVDAEEIAFYSNMLFNDKEGTGLEMPNFQDRSVTVLRYLNVHQRGFRYQAVPLKLSIFYPDLQAIPNFLDFGVVLVGNTRKMPLTLKNSFGTPLPFSVHKSFSSRAIVIDPLKGTIPAATAGGSSSVLVSFYFIPEEARVYSETVRVFTSVPFYHVTIYLTGTGSNNEKFHSEGL